MKLVITNDMKFAIFNNKYFNKYNIGLNIIINKLKNNLINSLNVENNS